MKREKLIEIFKSRNFVVPLYIFQLREKFSLPFEEFIFLIYLSNFEERFVFDPTKLASEFGLSLNDVMIYTDHLVEKGFLEMAVSKNDKGIMEEYLSLRLFYEKLSQFLVEDMVDSERIQNQEKKTIYDKISDGFARPISSIEREIIASWVENGFSEELILAALKETVFNGISNLRYMDKILHTWNKKGLKTLDDIKIDKEKHQREQRQKEKLELFDYDWFEDEGNE